MGGGWILLLLLAGVVAAVVMLLRKVAADAARQAERSEAMFRSMFPDIQPLFHPKNLLAYVRARRDEPRSGTWKSPPGFDVDHAELEDVEKGERVRLRDAAGALLAEFVYTQVPGGGVLRHGKGKFTVDIAREKPAVRYWHPDREFKWKNGAWTFTSRMSERSIESGDSGSSFSNDSSSPRASAATAAAAAGIVAAGGAFDGGGASQAWADGSAGEAAGGSAPAY